MTVMSLMAVAAQATTGRDGLNPHLRSRIDLVTSEARQLLGRAVDGMGLSARAVSRVLNVARTIADLATDEIRGGYEVKNGERVKVPGVLESFNLAQEDAELLILQARVAAGWIDASELPQPEPEAFEEDGEYAEGEYDPDQVFGEAGASEGGEGLEGAELESGDAEVFAEDLEKSRDA
mgnify:CR=1 FL=1